MARGSRTGVTAAAVVAVFAAIAVIVYRTNKNGQTPPESSSSTAPIVVPRSENTTTTAASPKIEEPSLPKEREALLANLRSRLAAGNSVDQIRTSLANLAKTDPALALDVAQVIGRNDVERARLVASVVQVWAQGNPQAAWDWTLQQAHRLDAAGEDSLVSVVLTQVAAADPQRAVEFTEAAMRNRNLLIDISLNEVAHAAVEALLKNDHTDVAERAVEQWVRGPGGTELGNAPFEAVAIKLAQTSPTAAASWLLSLPSSESRNFALATVAANWATTDPKASLDWANSLTSGAGREEAMQRAFNRWVAEDKVSAAQWLGEHEADPATDHMIASFVTDSPVSTSNPQVAMEWVDLISDPALRVQSLQQVARAWAEQNPAAATQYVQQNKKLTPEEKKRIVESLRNLSSSPGG
jgi:hypothetical protein